MREMGRSGEGEEEGRRRAEQLGLQLDSMM